MEVTIVDAFVGIGAEGNPAGVCWLEEPLAEARMQALATAVGLSETAFVGPHSAGPHSAGPHSAGWALRWFTPQAEVALCGHATLATAHYLFERGRADRSQPVTFHTLSGPLTARATAEGIALDFPAEPTTETPLPAALRTAIGAPVAYAGRNRFDWLLLLADEAAVRDLQPDLTAIAQLPERGVIVTARAAPGRPYDFVSRFFAPAVGVPEDPVTGSAHCALAPFWAARLGLNSLRAYQASARGGLLAVDHRGTRMGLTGQARTAETRRFS